RSPENPRRPRSDRGSRRSPRARAGRPADPCGEVVAVGADVTSPHVGQRVAVSPMLTCGACPMCRRGTENACLNLKILGVHRHGGYAELVRAPAGNALPLPDGLSYEEAACLPLSYRGRLAPPGRPRARCAR